MKISRRNGNKENRNASSGDCQSEQGIRSRSDAEPADAGGDGAIQRATGGGRGDASRRGPAAQFERQAGEVFGESENRNRRSFRRDKGAGRRFLDLEGELDRRGGRLAE